jgi:hypothetical protein
LPGISAAAETLGVTAGAFSTAAAGAAEGAAFAGGTVAAEGAMDATLAGAAETGAAATTATTTAADGMLATAAPQAAGGEALSGAVTEGVAAPATDAFAGGVASGEATAESASWVPKWFSDLPAPAQQAVGNAVVEGARGLYAGYAASEAEKEKERQRAEFQNNQQPVVLTWNGAPAYQGGPKDALAGGGMLDQAQPAAAQPQAAPTPQTPITHEIGRAATGAAPTASQRFAAPAPVSADEIERQRRLKTFQGGGMLSQART